MLNVADEIPERQTEIIIPYTETEWWLMRWSNNALECRIFTDHEGLPNDDDVYIYCGEDLYEDWQEMETCQPALEGGDTSTCKGLYIHQVVSEQAEKIVLVDLPLPEQFLHEEDLTRVRVFGRVGAEPAGQIRSLLYGHTPVQSAVEVRVRNSCRDVLEATVDLQHRGQVVSAQHVTPEQ